MRFKELQKYVVDFKSDLPLFGYPQVNLGVPREKEQSMWNLLSREIINKNTENICEALRNQKKNEELESLVYKAFTFGIKTPRNEEDVEALKDHLRDVERNLVHHTARPKADGRRDAIQINSNELEDRHLTLERRESSTKSRSPTKS